MPRQRIPDIEFEQFTIGQLPELFKKDMIIINEEYQRSNIWSSRQQVELIQSINSSYSIGVLVLFINKDGKYEILDGQQRLLTIKKYLDDDPELELEDTKIKKYTELGTQEKNLFDAYCVYYLKLKSFAEETREEDITQTFLRLQEGTPLNKAEKINAYRGAFKDTFRELRDTHLIFHLLGEDGRFRFRLLAAELLLLELKGDFKHGIFPALDLDTFKENLEKYKNNVDPAKVTFLKGNLDILRLSLNNLITGIKIRDLISFYLLVSYLRKTKAGNQNFNNELRAFAENFLSALHSFSVYDSSPPKAWPLSKRLFKRYRSYKEEGRKGTSAESIVFRFKFILQEYERQFPIVHKDSKRLFDLEQRRDLFFRQKGLCTYCRKPLMFKEGSADHVIAYGAGGSTDTANGQLLHKKCHEKLEEERRQSKTTP